MTHKEVRRLVHRWQPLMSTRQRVPHLAETCTQVGGRAWSLCSDRVLTRVECRVWPVLAMLRDNI